MGDEPPQGPGPTSPSQPGHSISVPVQASASSVEAPTPDRAPKPSVSQQSLFSPCGPVGEPGPRNFVPLKLWFFLSICDGELAPLSNAVRIHGPCVLAPFDANPKQGGVLHNLCEPAGQDLLFRLAWSRCVAMSHAGPPCGDMSMIKFLPGGPRPLRGPSALGGFDDLSAKEALAVQDSYRVHMVVIQALNAIYCCRGHISWENPPSSMAVLHEEVESLLRRIRAIVFPVARCQLDTQYFKEYLTATTFKPLREALESTCTHASHERWAGVRNPDGSYKSSNTALYPGGMVLSYAVTVAPLLTENPLRTFTEYDSLLNAPQPPPGPPTVVDFARQALVADGGGCPSQGDWSFPPPGNQDVFSELRTAWLDDIRRL